MLLECAVAREEDRLDVSVWDAATVEENGKSYTVAAP